MANVLRVPFALQERDQFVFFNDFFHLVTAQDGLTTLVADAGASATVGDTENGVASLVTGAVDENEAMVRTTAELFLVEGGRSIAIEARVQFGVATTNVFVGFASAAGANLLLDAGGGPRASGDVIGIYKVDGGTVWQAVSQINALRTVSTGLTAAAISTFYRLRVVIGDYDGTNVYTRFYVDGTELSENAGGRPVPIVHKTALASATEMNAAIYVKAGTAAGDTLLADYICAWQNRNAGF